MKGIKGITIDLSMNADKLTAKLRAISKHTAALAEELEQIDRGVCPNCNAVLDVTTAYADGEVYATFSICPKCGYTPSDSDD